MSKIVVNCEKLPFGKTLGVSHFLVKLCAALAKEYDLIFAIPDMKDFKESEARSIIESSATDIISFDDALKKSFFRSDNYLELLPHHFQEPKFGLKSVMICHDLHVYDVEWKYKEVQKLKKLFVENVRNADAVITHFPRTYYSLESITGSVKKSLFLTESPLLLDTKTNNNDRVIRKGNDKEVITLLFPSQLQEHKNHLSLINALSLIKEQGKQVQILCPGTTFKNSFSAKLKSLAKEKGVDKDIKFLGRVSDDKLRNLYWECDGVVVPSLAEGGAYVAFEAIAAGKPVAVNSIESAVQHLKSIRADVLWFDSTNVESTVKTLNQLISIDKEDNFAKNTQARERIDESTWTKVAEKWFLVFRWLRGEAEKPLVCIDRDGWNIEYKTSA